MLQHRVQNKMQAILCLHFIRSESGVADSTTLPRGRGTPKKEKTVQNLNNFMSNLIAENTSVLKERNRQIEYSYDGLNRLVKIQYPDTEDTVYTYGGSSAKNGAAGRILSLRDASGSLEYAYGALGEVIKETRTLNTHLHK
ncbi:MAG TPA: RHS repeat domain-containing protein, partial [Treponemataceae bacterium]|nr:RHS repeat domain-containing protein [Treponemataceae bacterium]